jgi:hypothetical protein
VTVILAIANHNGGVGKTVTAANVSAGFARAGRRTLAVDCDAQADLDAEGRMRTGVGRDVRDALADFRVTGARLLPVLVPRRAGPRRRRRLRPAGRSPAGAGARSRGARSRGAQSHGAAQ